MPYATSVIDLVTDLASQMEFAISVPAAGESQDDERDAENLENWLRAWLSKNAKQQQRNHIGEAAFLAAQRAQCVARTLFVEKSMQSADATRAEDDTVAGVPVVFQLRDPRHVHVADGPLGPRCVVERCQRLAADVRALYPKAGRSQAGRRSGRSSGRSGGRRLYRCYFVNDEPVKVRAARSSRTATAASPTRSATPARRPSPRARSVTGPSSPPSKTWSAVIDTWFSINATAGLAAVTNAWAVYSDTTLRRERQAVRPDARRQVNYLGTADKVQALQRAGMPPDFFQLGTPALSSLAAVRPSRSAIFGQSPGDMAGYAISLLSQAGRRIILPVWRAIEDMLAGAMLNCVTICANKVAPLTGNKIPLVITTQDSPTARPVKRKLRLDVTKFGADLDMTVSLADPMPQDVAAQHPHGAGIDQGRAALECDGAGEVQDQQRTQRRDGPHRPWKRSTASWRPSKA